MDQSIYSEEYSAGRLLSAAWKIFLQNAATVLAIVLLVAVPVNILSILANEAFSYNKTLDDTSLTQEQQFSVLMSELGKMAYSFVMLAVVTVFLGFFTLLSTLAMAFYVKSCVDGKNIVLQEAYSKAIGRWPAAILTSIIMGVLLIILSCLLILPGIYFTVCWIFATYAVALSGKSLMSALKYSRSIVMNRWWKVLAYYILFAILTSVVLVPVSIVSGVMHWAVSDHVASLIIDFGISTVSSAILSFFVVVQVVFFLNFEATIVGPGKPEAKPSPAASL